MRLLDVCTAGGIRTRDLTLSQRVALSAELQRYTRRKVASDYLQIFLKISRVDKVEDARLLLLSQRVVNPRVTEQKPHRFISVGLLHFYLILRTGFVSGANYRGGYEKSAAGHHYGCPICLIACGDAACAK